MTAHILKDFRYFLSWWVFRVLILNIVLGGTGIALIAFELFADRLQLRDTTVAGIVSGGLTYLGSLLTLVGVAVTAASIYGPARRATEPAPESKFTAFIVILACTIAAGFLIVRHSLPANIVNGFALLGLAGALFRLQPNPQRAASPVSTDDPEA